MLKRKQTERTFKKNKGALKMIKKQLIELGVYDKYCEAYESFSPHMPLDVDMFLECVNDILEAISGAFAWAMTKDGHIFWKNIYERILNDEY